MAKEIERKFLVSHAGWREVAEPGVAMVQFYVAAAADRSVRVRVRDGKDARLALKFGGNSHIRDEFEYPIPVEDAREMQAFALGAIIEKTRHLVRHGGHVYEVDVFGGALTGLVIAELETEATVAAKQLPEWLGREVTGEAAFYNASLARHGIAGLRP